MIILLVYGVSGACKQEVLVFEPYLFVLSNSDT